MPRYPGITSAIGLLTTDLKYDAIKTAFMTSGSVDYLRLNADFAAMQAQLVTQYQADGIAASDVTFAQAGDLRYVGQGYGCASPSPAAPWTAPLLRRCLPPSRRSTRQNTAMCLRTVQSR